MPGKLQIARKPKLIPTPATNGNVNGYTEPTGTKRKRSLEEDQQQEAKRGKMQMTFTSDGFQTNDVVIADDLADGAIVIEDD